MTRLDPAVPAPDATAGTTAPGTTMAAATLGRIAGTRTWRRFTTDVAGPGWARLADLLADPAALDAWVAAELAGTARGHRDLAGSLVAYRLAGSLAELAMVPLLAERRALLLGPDGVWLTFAGARIEAVGLPAPAVAVLPDDPEAGRPGTRVVAAPAGLHEALASGLVATFAGVAAAVRARAPFGLAGIWGTLADHLADVALRHARDHGGDPDRAWAEANAVVDALAGLPDVRLRARPQRHDVATPSAAGAFVTRGTCCLIYKCHDPGPGEPATTRARIEAAACTSCPLRAEDDRRARLVRHLEERAAAS